MTWALVDVENFYVSSERVFDPKLRGVPVLVLSNGDHCAIARSSEAKAFGVKMGAPVFKMRDLIKRHGFELRSSNYELYADMNRRFNAVIGEFSDQIEIYSIDESWFRLPVRQDGMGDTTTALAVIAKIKRDTGLPARIGLGPTRTLSKVANGLAKAGEKVFGGVIDLHDEELRKRLFRNWPVDEVWGIGRALTERLRPLGIRTTADLAAMDPHQARDVGTVVLERLVRELNGVGDDQLVVEPEKRQATAVTRMFGEPVSNIEELREAMARRAARAAEKIREQGSVAGRLIGFAHGNGRKANAPSAQRSCRLSPPTNDSRVIVRWIRCTSSAKLTTSSASTNISTGPRSAGSRQATKWVHLVDGAPTPAPPRFTIFMSCLLSVRDQAPDAGQVLAVDAVDAGDVRQAVGREEGVAGHDLLGRQAFLDRVLHGLDPDRGPGHGPAVNPTERVAVGVFAVLGVWQRHRFSSTNGAGTTYAQLTYAAILHILRL